MDWIKWNLWHVLWLQVCKWFIKDFFIFLNGSDHTCVCVFEGEIEIERLGVVCVQLPYFHLCLNWEDAKRPGGICSPSGHFCFCLSSVGGKGLPFTCRLIRDFIFFHWFCRSFLEMSVLCLCIGVAYLNSRQSHVKWLFLLSRGVTTVVL